MPDFDVIIINMPKDEKRKSRKPKVRREKTFEPLTKEQIERAERIARGEEVEEDEAENEKMEVKEE